MIRDHELAQLIKSFEEEKIKEAIEQMHYESAPGHLLFCHSQLWASLFYHQTHKS
jgi:hypothetical protein